MTKKTVLIYNQYLDGHHPSWFVMFIRACIKKGWRVVAVSPDASRLCAAVVDDENTKNTPQQLLWIHETEKIIANTGIKAALHHSYYLRLKNFLHILVRRYVYSDVEGIDDSGMPLVQKTKKKILCVFTRVSWFAFLCLRKFVNFLRYGTFVLPVNIHHRGHISASMLSAQLSMACKHAPWSVDYIFLMYVDSLYTDVRTWGAGDFPCAWGGMLLHPPQCELIGGEAWMSMPNFRGLCFLREDLKTTYAQKQPSKIFAVLPDVTHDGVSQLVPPLLAKIRERSRGRKIVLLCGAIDSRKNIVVFASLLRFLDSSEWFLVLCGKIYEHTLSDDDVEALKILRSASGAAYVHDAYVENEDELNALIKASSLLFAAYRDFEGSSNILSKSSFFEKPVIVSTGHLMQKKVEQYAIGLAVDQEDVEKAAKYIIFLDKNPVSETAFSTFRNEHSQDRLSDVLNIFVDDCLNK